MAITACKYVTGRSAAKLTAAIATEIAASRYPVGAICVRPVSVYPAIFEIGVGVGTGATALTAWKVLEADSLTALNALVTTEIGNGNLPIGGLVVCPYLDGGWNGLSTSKARYYQAVGQ